MTPTRLRDINKRSDVRKQRIRPHKITWPVAPDGYIPNSVVRSLAPYPKFNRSHSCASKGLQVEEDKTLILTEKMNYLLRKHFRPNEEQNTSDPKNGLEDGMQSVPEETKIRSNPKPFQGYVSGETKTEANLTPLRRGVPQRQYLLQNRQNASSSEEVQTDASSMEELQTSTSSAEELQTDVSTMEELQTSTSSAEELQMDVSTMEELQTSTSSAEELQTNAATAEELKNEEDCDFIHPPKIVPGHKSNGFPTKQAKKGQKVSFKLPGNVDVEMVSSITEQLKSFPDSINKNGLVPEIGDPNQNKKTNFSLKKLKSLVPPLLPMGDRRPDSVLVYLYKRSKAES